MGKVDTIVAAATPPGRGGVGIVRVSGPKVPEIAAVILGDLPPARRATFARFLDAEPPVNGKVVLDFNQAINPPCAFTPFATCPLPPYQNRLKLKVEAGEKKYAGGREHLRDR